LERGAVSTEAPGKCIRPPAPIVGRIVKFPSNPLKGAQSTVKIVTGNEDHLEGIDTKSGIVSK
jgi:hypothetical protein